MIRYTTTQDKKSVPTSSQFIAPRPSAIPTIKVPLTPPMSRSTKGWFFLNTRCLKLWSSFRKLFYSKFLLQNKNKNKNHLLPKLFDGTGCPVTMMKLYLCMVLDHFMVRCCVFRCHKARWCVPPTL